jgi:hypothetical protein
MRDVLVSLVGKDPSDKAGSMHGVFRLFSNDMNSMSRPLMIDTVVEGDYHASTDI